MSGLPSSAGSPDQSSTNGPGGDIHMSNISHNNNSYSINDHNYDGLINGNSTTASASTVSALASNSTTANNIGAQPLSGNTSHFGTLQESNYMNPNHNNHNHNHSRINSYNNNNNNNNNNNPHHPNTLGLNSNALATRDSGLAEGLIRKATLTGGTTGVSEAKLKRFLDHNQRLREQLEMRRVPVSEASNSLIQYVTTTRDPLLPVIWGTVGPDPFAKQSSRCCTIS